MISNIFKFLIYQYLVKKNYAIVLNNYDQNIVNYEMKGNSYFLRTGIYPNPNFELFLFNITGTVLNYYPTCIWILYEW